MKMPTPPRRPNVIAHHYDLKSKTLTVMFHGGQSYKYSGVSQETAHTFNKADSRGTFLHDRIIPHHKAIKL